MKEVFFYPDRTCACGCGKRIPIKPFHKWYGIPKCLYPHMEVGKKLSEETKRKIGRANKGKKRSERTKQRMRGKIHKLDCLCASCKSKRGETKGANSPTWKGGLSFNYRAYPSDWTDTLKRSVRQRDNYTCQLCNKAKRKTRDEMAVHHIDYDKENLNPKNLTTLCRSCHSKTNFSRKSWTKFFQLRLKLRLIA